MCPIFYGMYIVGKFKKQSYRVLDPPNLFRVPSWEQKDRRRRPVMKTI